MVVAGLCRLLARKGIRVAPFKAQNMSNNSAVTAEGGEIGRAQAMQARAAGLAPSVRFNPILLKPGSDRTSQLVVRGQVADTVSAADYFTHRDRLGRRRRRRIALAAKRIRRGDLRGRGLARRDQPARNRSGQHGPGPRRGSARRAGRRHRPRRAAGAPVRHGRGARTRRPALIAGIRRQQVPRRPRPAGTRAATSCTT